MFYLLLRQGLSLWLIFCLCCIPNYIRILKPTTLFPVLLLIILHALLSLHLCLLLLLLFYILLHLMLPLLIPWLLPSLLNPCLPLILCPIQLLPSSFPFVSQSHSLHLGPSLSFPLTLYFTPHIFFFPISHPYFIPFLHLTWLFPLSLFLPFPFPRSHLTPSLPPQLFVPSTLSFSSLPFNLQ